jgi:hypothetical protein
MQMECKVEKSQEGKQFFLVRLFGVSPEGAV